MELIVKQPIGKPPFIGILFEKEYEASKLNQYQVEPQPEKTRLYRAIIEPKGELINLTLIEEKTNWKFKYEGLKYEFRDISIFLEDTIGSDLYNFSHLVLKQGKHQVVKTISTNDYYILKLINIKLVMEEF